MLDRGIVKSLEASQFTILPEEVWTASKGSTTPSVENVRALVFLNTGAVTVTDFLKGSSAQQLLVLGDGFTTIQHGTRVKNASGVNLLLAANKVYQYILYANVWYGLTTT